MQSQWRNFAIWTGAIAVIVLASVLYEPAAAKTGSLLVWTRNKVYVMDIDTLNLEPVGAANSYQNIAPSPGCFGHTEAPCWVAVSDRIYAVRSHTIGQSNDEQAQLPVGEAYRWNDGAVSWSPDGRHLAYSVAARTNNEAELRVYDVTTGEVALKAATIDPTVAVAWTRECSLGLTTAGCELAYKQMPHQEKGEVLPLLIGYSPATDAVRHWIISPEPIFELRWSADHELLYSRPKRHFLSTKDHAPAYDMPAGALLGSMSPDAGKTVYYQPFRLKNCEAVRDENDCLHLGIWLSRADAVENSRELIYSVKAENRKSEALNFIPVWSAQGDAFVIFQDGQLIHYDLTEDEALIWYKSLTGKLRSLPVFSPNEEAVAFVDNQGQGYSEYRLIIVNPKLQPIEHIIETESGFLVLAWLPN